MLTIDSRRRPAFGTSLAVLLAGCFVAAACDGNIGANGSGGSGGSGIGGLGGNNVKPGDPTVPPTPIPQEAAYVAVRKVKNLLVGMPPTDEEVALVTTSGAAGLQQLVAKWQTGDAFIKLFEGKMIGFFRNAFQQTGFTPTEDFKLQLLTNGGFDFGPGGARLAGDDAFRALCRTFRTASRRPPWQIVQEGRPFTEVLTTNKFVMTTALKSLYIQVEMPADAPFNNGSAMPAWKLDYSGNPIPIEQAISTMTFSDEAPATGNGNGFFTNCRGWRDGGGGRFPGDLADLPASARVHAAFPVFGQPDLVASSRRSPTSRPAISATGTG
jgi:hypothetical protein